MDMDKFIRHSHAVEYEDLDWEEAARIGLTDTEKTILTTFSDIEAQTVFYMREVLRTKAIYEPDVLTFVTLWNYEEFYHGHALARLLEACGAPLGDDRVTRVRTSVQLLAKIEDFVQISLSRMLPETFMALYMTWGASQELLTLRGYEQLALRTLNPALRELATRIALQERRHFAWYFNNAKERLARSRFSQKAVRMVFERFWTPVGVGVKSPEQMAELVINLFPGPVLMETMTLNDRKLGSLPGMEGFDVMRQFAATLQPYMREEVDLVSGIPVPAEARAVAR